MTDRVPGAPGQYSAVIQPEELEKLQNGENFIITLTRDDQPITPGTPYSKAAVLPDELAAVICPGVEDPAPKDAFQALADKMIESTEYPGCYYRVTDGVTEWINPPMVDGKEYRTTKRDNGSPIYSKRVDFGALPANAVAGVELGLTGDVLNMLKITVIATNQEGHEYPFPFFNAEGEFRGYARMSGNRTLQIRTFSDLSMYTGKLIAEYTKA